MVNPPLIYADIHSRPARVVWRAYDKPYFGVLTFDTFEKAWTAFGEMKSNLLILNSLGVYHGCISVQSLVSDFSFRSRRRYMTHDYYEFDDLPF